MENVSNKIPVDMIMIGTLNTQITISIINFNPTPPHPHQNTKINYELMKKPQIIRLVVNDGKTFITDN